MANSLEAQIRQGDHRRRPTVDAFEATAFEERMALHLLDALRTQALLRILHQHRADQGPGIQVDARRELQVHR